MLRKWNGQLILPLLSDLQWMSNGSLERECVSEGIVEADGYDVSHSIGGFTSPAALQRALGTEDKTAEGGTVLRGNSAPDR